MHTNRNHRLTLNLDEMTVTVNQKPLPSPSGNGYRMASIRDAAYAMLDYVLGDDQARKLYWDFADMITDRELDGDDIIIMSEDEIKCWSSFRRCKL